MCRACGCILQYVTHRHMRSETCHGTAAVLVCDDTVQGLQRSSDSGVLLNVRGRACRGLARLLGTAWQMYLEDVGELLRLRLHCLLERP